MATTVDENHDAAPFHSAQASGLLRWRSRRGQRELDLLMERYLDRRYPTAPQEERQAYARLLEQPDPDILNWVLGRASPPAELRHVIHALTADH